MGLDITAYSKLEADPSIADGDQAYYEGAIWLYVEEGREGRAEPLTGGAYRCHGEQMGFRAGSYSGYNLWREYLAEMIGTTPKAIWNRRDETPKPPVDPFVELIDFSDCEGVIGSKVAAKLAKDFATLAHLVEPFAKKITNSDNREWFVAKYNEWRKAFELAADGGAVRFH